MAKAAAQHSIPTVRATTHKPRHQKENRDSARKRGYDAQWDAFRLGFLASNPLCEYCLGKGITKPARVVDHDLPHEHDIELFWNNTYTALCKLCHDSTKARLEARYSGDELLEAVASIKRGDSYGSPNICISGIASAGATLVYGPPCAGKTTWAKANANGAVIYDLDEIAVSIGFKRYGRTRQQGMTALNEMKQRLSRHDKSKRIILITTAPTARRRKAWVDMINPDTIKLIIEPQSVCIARAEADKDRRKHIEVQREIIKKWFECAE